MHSMTLESDVPSNEESGAERKDDKESISSFHSQYGKKSQTGQCNTSKVEKGGASSLSPEIEDVGASGTKKHDSNFGIAQLCINALQNEFTDRTLKAIVRPVAGLIYNEIFPYMWTLCIYNIFVFVLLLLNSCLLVKLYWASKFP
jgi:hypothetical protein